MKGWAWRTFLSSKRCLCLRKAGKIVLIIFLILAMLSPRQPNPDLERQATINSTLSQPEWVLNKFLISNGIEWIRMQSLNWEKCDNLPILYIYLHFWTLISWIEWISLLWVLSSFWSFIGFCVRIQNVFDEGRIVYMSNVLGKYAGLR